MMALEEPPETNAQQTGYNSGKGAHVYCLKE
jgi:hypothetical protein